MILLTGGGACVVARGGSVCGCLGGHAWLLRGGVRDCSRGGMCGCSGGCMVFAGGHAWFLLGGVRGFSGGGMRRIRRDTVNERAIRILLECILVYSESAQRDRNLKFSKTKIQRDLYGRHFIYDTTAIVFNACLAIQDVKMKENASHFRRRNKPSSSYMLTRNSTTTH